MKSIFAIVLSIILTNSAFGQSQNAERIESIPKIVEQLETLKGQLKDAKSNRNRAALKLVIAAPIAVALGLVSKSLIKGGFSDSSSGIGLAAGLGVGGLTLIPITYSGYQAYEVVINQYDIEKFENLISSKLVKLEAAKRIQSALE